MCPAPPCPSRLAPPVCSSWTQIFSGTILYFAPKNSFDGEAWVKLQYSVTLYISSQMSICKTLKIRRHDWSIWLRFRTESHDSSTEVHSDLMRRPQATAGYYHPHSNVNPINFVIRKETKAKKAHQIYSTSESSKTFDTEGFGRASLVNKLCGGPRYSYPKRLWCVLNWCYNLQIEHNLMIT